MSIVPSSLLVTAALTLISASTQAAVVNGDFASGTLTGWSTIGVASVQKLDWLSANPAATVNQAVLSSAVPEPQWGNAAAVESFLTLTPGSLTTLPGVVEGSGMFQVLNGLTAGDTLSFNWNFYTGDDYQDRAFYTLHPATSTGALTVLATSTDPRTATGNAEFAYATGFKSTTVTVPSSGNYVLGFGVVDVGNYPAADSALGVSNVTYTPVPEPWAWSMMTALALGGLAAVRRMRQQRA